MFQPSPSFAAAAYKRLQATLVRSRLYFGIRRRTLSSATRDSFQLINRSKFNDDVGSALHTKIASFPIRVWFYAKKWCTSRVPRKEERVIRPLTNQVSPFHHVSTQHHTSIRPGIPRSGLSALRTIREHRVAPGMHYRTFSGTANSKLPAFEGAGVEVTEDFVQGDEINDNVKRQRVPELDALPEEMIDLFRDLQLASSAKPYNTHRVQHLGENVYAQYSKYDIHFEDTKTNSVILTREESRSVVWHSLDALKQHYKVCVTGQPGIGKTRGCMTYAIQALLYQRQAVLYVGYKTKRMFLFLPNKDGTYRVWKTKAANFEHSFLSDDPRVYAVIDPPENGPYDVGAGCHVLMYASNNAKKHFNNWEKDGILLVTSMPTKEEVIVMTKVLWDEKITPHSWQREKSFSLEEKVKEIEKRIDLVGSIPRLVFNSSLFVKAVNSCRKKAKGLAKDLSELELYNAMIAAYTSDLDSHPADTSGKLFHLFLEPILAKTWVERKELGQEPTLKLNAVTTLELRSRLEKSIAMLRKENFEDFAFDWVCATQGRLPEIHYDEIQYTDEVKSEASAYQRIASPRNSEQRAYRPASEKFPMIDFATNCITWINAKSTKNTGPIEIGIDGAKKFLKDLQNCIENNGLSAYFKELVKREAPKLIVLKNRNVKVKLSKKEDLMFFNEKVEIKDVDLSDTGKSTSDCYVEISGYTRTSELQKELERETGKLPSRRAKL